MAGHFSSLGFLAHDESAMLTCMVRMALDQGEAMPCALGTYVYWRVGDGVEIWVHLDHERHEVMSCEPHFAGTSRVTARLDACLPDPTYPLEGKFSLWHDEGPPFVCSVPDFQLAVARLTASQPVTLQLAAFAQRLTCYDDEAAYLAAQGDKTPKFSANFFIPTGLFTQDERPPRALARFAGTVQACERRVNPATNGAFLALSVTTFIGTVDVVADETLVATPPTVGGIVSGDFWLSGRVGA